MELDQSFCFIYSKRPGTDAASYPDDVSFATKQKRLKELQTIIKEQTKIISQRMLGTIQKVLVTTNSKEQPNAYFGKTENNRNVHFTSPNMPIGQVVLVHITKARINNLYGETIA